jgi:hypothetical protein
MSEIGPVTKTALTGILAVVALAVPGVAAADTTIATDPGVSSSPGRGQMAALDGTIVWVSGDYPTEVLMQHTDAGSARVAGAPQALAYHSLDLGHDARGRLVLTYQRCASPTDCRTLRDDLHGHREGITGLTRPRCSLSAAPAIWGRRTAYGLYCHKPRSDAVDEARSGLYVKTGSGTPRHLPRPRKAIRYHAATMTSVDLSGSRVSAVATGGYEYAFSETVTGRGLHSFLSVSGEQDGGEFTTAAVRGEGDSTLAMVEGPLQGLDEAIVFRLSGGCLESESVVDPEGSGHPPSALAVDGPTLYLAVAGVGIVRHAFSPGLPSCGH